MYGFIFPKSIGHGINVKNSEKDVDHDNANKGSPPAKSADTNPGTDTDTDTVVASATEGSDAATATASTHAPTGRPLITAGKRARGNATPTEPSHKEVVKKVRFEENDAKNACIASPTRGSRQPRQGAIVRHAHPGLINSTIFSLPPIIAKPPNQEDQANKPRSLSQRHKQS